MKKRFGIKYVLIIFALFYTTNTVYGAQTYNIDGKNILYNYPPIKIVIDQIEQNPKMQPLMIENHVFVPIRFISDKLGADIGYDSSKVWINYKGKKIILYYYKDTAYLNGNPVKLDASVKLINYGYTYVPFRFIGEAFGNSINWDKNTNTVYLSSTTSSNQINQTTTVNASNSTQNSKQTLSNLYTIDKINFESINDNKYISILTKDTDYTAIKNNGQNTIYIDFNNAKLNNQHIGFGIDDKIVKGVIPIQLTQNTVRIIITLNSDANYSVSQQDGKLLINLQPISMNLPSSIIVNADTVNIRTAPGIQSDIITQVNNKDILSVIDKSGDWYKVRLQNGVTGWIAGWLTVANDNYSNISARRELISSNTKPSRGGIGQALISLPYGGKGVWYSIYSKMPDANDLSFFRNANITHIYLEVATSTAGFPDKWKKWLDDIVPAAHRAGIKVIAWLYTDLKDTSYDADLTAQVANYITPSGDSIDAVAADIEDLPQNDIKTASKIVEDYAIKTRNSLPSGMPFIAITYPPQYRPNYPYISMAKNFDVIALMDYWHVSDKNYTYDDAKNFVSDSIKRLQALVGSVPIEVILHGYDEGKGLPSSDELRGAIDASINADGYSIYTWNTLNDELKGVFANYNNK